MQRESHIGFAFLFHSDIAESKLVALVTHLLLGEGSIPVGKMGSMLHTLTNNHSLPAMLKERYGGLKKFLQRYEQVFKFENDHPYNPHVSLRYPPQNMNAGGGQQAAGASQPSGKIRCCVESLELSVSVCSV